MLGFHLKKLELFYKNNFAKYFIGQNWETDFLIIKKGWDKM